MNKKLFFIILLCLFVFPFFVYAEDYEIQTLIPINTHATVKTDKFLYGDFYYTYVDGSKEGLISFSSITNNTVSKTAVSINILLFNEEQKNIGFVTYCSDKDYSSNYSGFKLSGNQSAPFSISVVSKYFVDGYYPSDVRYISVYDENKYCHIGGYDNYKDLTIDQIVNGAISKKDTFHFSLFEFFSGLGDFGLFPVIVKIIGVLFFLYIIGIALNMLHERMYVKRTVLAFIPLIDFFVSMKMAFGKIVSTIYLILSIIACILYYFNIPILLYVIVGLFIISLLINLFKFFSKKYDLFIIEPSIKAVGLESNNAFTAEVPKEKKNFSFFKKKKKNNDTNHFINSNSSTNFDQPYLDSQNDILDLSYDDKNITVSTSLQSNENNNDLFNVSVGEIANTGNNTDSSLDSNNMSNESTNNENGDSDLYKFFH